MKRKAPAERCSEKRICLGDQVPLLEEENNLEDKLKKSELELEKVRKENILLKKKLREKDVEVHQLKLKLKRMSEDIPIAKIFGEDQIESIKKKKTLIRWSDETVKSALSLKFSCGTNGYRSLLEAGLPYPSVRTLQRRLEHIKFVPGILYEVLDLLNVKIKHFKTEQEKLCNLALDEMTITESTEFDMSTGTYFGNVTFPGQTGKANHVLVFMLWGLSTRWKQVIAYYFTNGKSDGEQLKNIILRIIEETDKIGLKIVNITSDMGSSNRAMWKCFGISSTKMGVDKSHIVHPFDSTQKITFMADVPHLLKNLKSSLLSNKFFIIPNDFKDKYNLPSVKVDPKHLNELLNYQEDMELKLTPKLTSSHLDNKHFDKMKVSKATDVISHEVGAALKLVAKENDDDCLNTTAWFLQYVRKWFDLMTSRHPVMALSKFNFDKYVQTVIFLAEVIQLFKTIKIIDCKNKIKWKPIQTGIIISTVSILHLQTSLLGEKQMKYILTSRFTQDFVENFFSLVRYRQIIPTALQFRHNLKLICIAQYLKVPKGSYEIDDGEFVPGFLDLLKNVKKCESKILLPKDWDINPQNLSNAELNCLYNVAGYIVSRLIKSNSVCEVCLSNVASKNNIDSSFSKFVELKQYKNSCLVFVTKYIFLNLFCPLEYSFRNLEPHLITSEKSCVLFLKEHFNNIIKEINLPTCHNIKTKIVNRFINFRLKIFGMKKNKEHSNLKTPEIQLGSKSSTMRVLANKI